MAYLLCPFTLQVIQANYFRLNHLPNGQSIFISFFVFYLTTYLLAIFRAEWPDIGGRLTLSTLFKYHYNPTELAVEKLQNRIHLVEEDLAKPAKVGDIFAKLVTEMDEVNGVFALRSKKLLPYRDGSGYFLVLNLADKTGQVEGRVWERAEEVSNCCQAGDVIRVTGRAAEYKGTIQLNITEVEKCPDGEVVPEMFIPSTGIPVGKV